MMATTLIATPSPPPPTNQISLGQLCTSLYSGCQETQAIDVGSQVFDAAMWNAGYAPAWGDTLTYQDSPCTKLVLQFAVKNSDTDDIGRVRVNQSGGAASQSAMTTTGHIGSLKATLSPGQTFEIQVNSDHGNLDNVYLNGYAVCTST